jgi:tetratricopeptide (TPR) repeat protein
MVLKNEVQTVERSIQSVRNFVDEVVVGLDVASDDGTKEIVERLADKVIDIHLSEELAKKGPVDGGGDWGFSRARNQVLDACKPDNWRVILDGHETIKNPEDMIKALEEAVEKSFEGVEIMMHFEPRAGNIPQLMYGTSRLLAPSVRYSEPIHNVPVISKMFRAHNVIVEHRKVDQKPDDRRARDIQRSDSNIQGLKDKLRIDSNDARTWFYLATAYKENGRFDESIKAYEECLKFSVWSEERWHARTNMGTCYSCLGDNEKARLQFSLALEEFPVMAEAYYWLGELAYRQERFREAQVWLEKCIQIEVPKCRLFMNPSIYLTLRYDLLAMTYSHIGRYEDAIATAKKALENVSDPRIEKNIQVWEIVSQHRPPEGQTVAPKKANGKLVHYCGGMSFFGQRLERFYGFSRYNPQTDLAKPVLFQGLYFQEDYDLFQRHQGRTTVFWNGSDVLRMLNNVEWQRIVAEKIDVSHFCHNQQLQSELALVGIKATIHPVFFSDVNRYEPSFKPSKTPQVYMTSHPGRNPEYGIDTVLEIAPELPDVTFHVYGVDGDSTDNVKFHGLVDEGVVDREIVDFQGCLRLNKHDGFSQSVMKSILLAQYPICFQEVVGTMQATNKKELVACLNQLKEKTEPNLALREHYLGQFSSLPM